MPVREARTLGLSTHYISLFLSLHVLHLYVLCALNDVCVWGGGGGGEQTKTVPQTFAGTHFMFKSVSLPERTTSRILG